MDQERDKLFDHDYDGIREYDNPMPKWWVYIFVGSILFCFPYVLHYHFGKGLSLEQALDREIEAYAAQLLETYGELEPSHETIVSYMDNEVAMTGMAGLFRGKCAQCHLADGTGQVGPNLTDTSWINVKQITDIPSILQNGVDGKGMPGWGDRLTTTEIVLLSSYVARLSRDPQPGKAAEGDVISTWRKSPEPNQEEEEVELE